MFRLRSLSDHTLEGSIIGDELLEEEEKNWIDPRIELIKSQIHGRGMRAIDDIPKGDIILIWREGYTDKEGALKAKEDGKHVFQWAEDVFSIDTGIMEDAYYVNHSCDPNTWLEDAHRLSAMRDIKRGEEITVDYAIFEYDESTNAGWTCNCGARNCRGKVTGNDWMDPELQERYRGHFSPLFNERIEKQMK